MTLRRAITSILHLFVVFTYLGMALFCIALSYTPEWQVYLADAVLYHPEVLKEFGFYFAGVFLFFMLVFYWLNRGKFIRFSMGRHVVELKESMVRRTVDTFFKKHCPKVSLVDLEIIGTSKIEIKVDLQKSLEPEKAELLLQQLEVDLGGLFYDRFGYKRSFVLSLEAKKISFPEKI